MASYAQNITTNALQHPPVPYHTTQSVHYSVNMTEELYSRCFCHIPLLVSMVDITSRLWSSNVFPYQQKHEEKGILEVALDIAKIFSLQNPVFSLQNPPFPHIFVFVDMETRLSSTVD